MLDPNDPRSRRMQESQDGESGHLWRRRVMLSVISLLAVGLFASGLTVAYRFGVEAGGTRTIPLITADGGPTKVRPADPGGMDIPNQDRAIFRQLAQSGADARIERLKPDEERPIENLLLTIKPPATPRSSPVEGDGSAGDMDRTAAPETGTGAALPGPDQLPRVPPEEKAVPEPPPGSLAVTKPKSLPSSPLLSTGQTMPPPPPPAPPERKRYTKAQEQIASTGKGESAGGRYRVQVASVTSAPRARQAWAKLSEDHPELFSGLQQSVVKTDLGAKGTWYRVVAGPFASASAATAFCDRAKKRRLGCLIVRP